MGEVLKKRLKQSKFENLDQEVAELTCFCIFPSF